MLKKFSCQLPHEHTNEDNIMYQLDEVAYGSVNKSMVHHSIKHSGTTEDIMDNLSLGEKSRTGCKCKKIGCLKLYC